MKKIKTKRKNIPKTLKNKVWDKYIGKEKGIGKCICCDCEIDSKNFECGHVISVNKGGPTTIENMRPICNVCNKSMGDKNLFDFKENHFPENKSLLDNLIDVNKKTLENFIYDKLTKFISL